MKAAFLLLDLRNCNAQHHTKYLQWIYLKITCQAKQVIIRLAIRAFILISHIVSTRCPARCHRQGTLLCQQSTALILAALFPNHIYRSKARSVRPTKRIGGALGVPRATARCTLWLAGLEGNGAGGGWGWCRDCRTQSLEGYRYCCRVVVRRIDGVIAHHVAAATTIVCRKTSLYINCCIWRRKSCTLSPLNRRWALAQCS